MTDEQSRSSASKIVLPRFTLTEVCTADAPGAMERTLQPTTASSASYFYRPVVRPVAYSQTGPTYSYNLMPVVLDGAGAPWPEANLYLISRIEGVLAPSMATYHGIADDLAAFCRFLEEDGVDYRVFPRRRLLRPTYRYRAYLQQKIMARELAATTARRRISSIIGFYRWLSMEGVIVPDNPLWEEHDVYIQLTDDIGFRRSKVVTATDIGVKIPVQNDPYSGTVEDGGKLRPLPLEEQQLLLEALLELGNTEMTLIHMLALFTGARIQTALTLHVGHVQSKLASNVTEFRLPVGPGTSIDTKNGKRMVLHLPAWLYEKLRIYAMSTRAIQRRRRAGSDTADQYLFLSSRGVPMYSSKVDQATFNDASTLRHEKHGQAVRQYIREFIIPAVSKRLGRSFHYRFHDLRASFGMNLTDHQLSLARSGQVTLHQVREFVKTRMGHESSATTDLYLQFRQHVAMVERVQQGYEEHLQQLIDTAMEGEL